VPDSVFAEALEIEPYQLFYNEATNLGQTVREKHWESVKHKLIEAVSFDICSAFDELKNN